MKKLAVLVSGTGSILEAMIKDGLDITVVLADRDCRGIEIARAADVPTIIVDRREYGWKPRLGDDWDREGFTQAVIETLDEYGIELVAMAGFMTILSPLMEKRYGGRWLNTHPSLLPAFKGEHAVRDALEYGVKVTGCTIHQATSELDAGPIMAQECVRVEDGDTEETLHERIKVKERKLYTATVRQLQSA